MARSLNRASLIGNLTRDPELRYTPQGTAVCTFGIATNRQWKTDTGEKKDEADFHRIVAWNKLAELCAQLLKKGNRAFVEGRIQTRKWTGKDGAERTTTEIVISDMMVLSAKGQSDTGAIDVPEDFGENVPQETPKEVKPDEKKSTEAQVKEEDDIPF